MCVFPASQHKDVFQAYIANSTQPFSRRQNGQALGLTELVRCIVLTSVFDRAIELSRHYLVSQMGFRLIAIVPYAQMKFIGQVTNPQFSSQRRLDPQTQSPPQYRRLEQLGISISKAQIVWLQIHHVAARQTPAALSTFLYFCSRRYHKEREVISTYPNGRSRDFSSPDYHTC